MFPNCALTLFGQETNVQINQWKSSLSPYAVEKPNVLKLNNILPFTLTTFDGGFKYLGFHLKAIYYCKYDWNWMIPKMETMLKSWSVKWLSSAGKLIPIKLVLEAIFVYCMSLSLIPKGVLEKLLNIYLWFLWVQSKDQYVVPWVKREIISIQKTRGRWGLKTIPLFDKDFVAKVRWRLLSTDNLWTNVVLKKYIHPDSLVGWIRNPNNPCCFISIIWKQIIKSFSLIEKGLA